MPIVLEAAPPRPMAREEDPSLADAGARIPEECLETDLTSLSPRARAARVVGSR